VSSASVSRPQKSIFKNKKLSDPNIDPSGLDPSPVVRPRRRWIGGALTARDDELLWLAHVHPIHPEVLRGQVDGHGRPIKSTEMKS
jgi:hypothetical protein